MHSFRGWHPYAKQNCDGSSCGTPASAEFLPVSKSWVVVLRAELWLSFETKSTNSLYEARKSHGLAVSARLLTTRITKLHHETAANFSTLLDCEAAW